MYEAFYGFREKPFSIVPQLEFFYPSERHRMALDMLQYGLINQALFSVITGEIGTGKTTMIRYLLTQMGRGITVGMIANTHRSFGELLQWALLAMKIDYRGKEKIEMYQDFLEFLAREHKAGRRVVLIIDEAQNMSPDALEELRMLSNINLGHYQPLQIILVGQTDLRELLNRPDLRQFAQRVVVDYHLEPLERGETLDYLQHRIRIAGGRNPCLFGEEAGDAVYRYTRGVPRLINLLCDRALVYGFAEQKPQIDLQIIQDAVRDRPMEGGGLFHAGGAPAARFE